MPDSPKNVVNWFTDAEEKVDELLGFVPYCDEHKDLWSPQLVSILLDICSQLDSLWSWEMRTKRIKPLRPNFCIVDYFINFGYDVASKWAVFWVERGEKIQPFSPWSSLTSSDFNEKNWEGHSSEFTLEWWQAYQRIKHDRIKEQKKAKLKYVAEALCGLLLAIIRCEDCWDALWENGCISLDDTGGLPIDPFELLKKDFGRNVSNSCPDYHMAIETKLFSYPVLYCNEIVQKGSVWPGGASNRFKAWFYEREFK